MSLLHPLQPSLGFLISFVPTDTSFFVFFGRFGPLGIPIFRRQNTQLRHSSMVRQGLTEHGWKKARVISIKRRGHLDFCGINVQISASPRSYLWSSSFKMESILGVKYELLLTYAVRPSNIRVKLCINMPWTHLDATRSEKKWGKK